MTNPNQHEASPINPVSPETAASLRTAVYEMTMVPVREGLKPAVATLTFATSTDESNFLVFDFDDDRPDSIGSRPVVADDDTQSFYEAWAKSESGHVSATEHNGEPLIPYGFVHEVRPDPKNPVRIMSHIILPTTSGRILEIDQGDYLDDDGSRSTRELGEQEVQELLARMQTVMSSPKVYDFPVMKI